jgi:cytosine/uracil/thiamine/allantoin permease
MEGEKTNVKKSSLVAAVIFAVAFVIYSFLFVSKYETGTASMNSLRGILAGLFGILAIMNYLKHKRAKA